MKLFKLSGIVFILLLAPHHGFAQETSGSFENSIKVGDDSRDCDGTTEGNLRYNSGALEYCDGTAWTDPADSGGGGSCVAPSDCSTIGSVCGDGSQFAGFMIYDNSTCEALYVTDQDQPTGDEWRTVRGNNDITDTTTGLDYSDGHYNRDNRGGGTFPAFERCEDNTYHSKSDWYLPSAMELEWLWVNRDAIDANATGSFSTSRYWSSTEYVGNDDRAYRLDFGDGSWIPTQKDGGSSSLRCVRRD